MKKLPSVEDVQRTKDMLAGNDLAILFLFEALELVIKLLNEHGITQTVEGYRSK